MYDGVLYATRSFAYIRNALTVGFMLIFAPALALVVGSTHSLLGVWTAKATLNIWRCATALYRIHIQLWPEWTHEPSIRAKEVPPEVPPAPKDPVDRMKTSSVV